MIGCYFAGRLGNQLFRYAYVRMLYRLRGSKDELVFNFRRVGGMPSQGFEDSLSHFNVLPYTTCNRSLVLRYGSARQKSVYACFRIMGKAASYLPLGRDVSDLFRTPLLKQGILHQGSGDNHLQLNLPASKNVFVDGFFENRRYFDAIRPVLLREFTPKASPLPHNKELYEAIGSRQSVCVSVRRGDYLSPQYRQDFYVCDEEYVHRAIRAVEERVDNPLFVFFSDDIEWVRRHIKLPEGSLYECGSDPVWEKLRLMYSCKHFIISNSSFSWWAQYLSRNEEKTVVAPLRWFNNSEWTSHLLEDSFIKV